MSQYTQAELDWIIARTKDMLYEYEIENMHFVYDFARRQYYLNFIYRGIKLGAVISERSMPTPRPMHPDPAPFDLHGWSDFIKQHERAALDMQIWGSQVLNLLKAYMEKIDHDIDLPAMRERNHDDDDR